MGSTSTGVATPSKARKWVDRAILPLWGALSVLLGLAAALGLGFSGLVMFHFGYPRDGVLSWGGAAVCGVSTVASGWSLFQRKTSALPWTTLATVAWIAAVWIMNPREPLGAVAWAAVLLFGMVSVGLAFALRIQEASEPVPPPKRLSLWIARVCAGICWIAVAFMVVHAAWIQIGPAKPGWSGEWGLGTADPRVDVMQLSAAVGCVASVIGLIFAANDARIRRWKDLGRGWQVILASLLLPRPFCVLAT